MLTDKDVLKEKIEYLLLLAIDIPQELTGLRLVVDSVTMDLGFYYQMDIKTDSFEQACEWVEKIPVFDFFDLTDDNLKALAEWMWSDLSHLSYFD